MSVSMKRDFAVSPYLKSLNCSVQVTDVNSAVSAIIIANVKPMPLI